MCSHDRTLAGMESARSWCSVGSDSTLKRHPFSPHSCNLNCRRTRSRPCGHSRADDVRPATLVQGVVQRGMQASAAPYEPRAPPTPHAPSDLVLSGGRSGEVDVLVEELSAPQAKHPEGEEGQVWAARAAHAATTHKRISAAREAPADAPARIARRKGMRVKESASHKHRHRPSHLGPQASSRTSRCRWCLCGRCSSGTGVLSRCHRSDLQ